MIQIVFYALTSPWLLKQSLEYLLWGAQQDIVVFEGLSLHPCLLRPTGQTMEKQSTKLGQ